MRISRALVALGATVLTVGAVAVGGSVTSASTTVLDRAPERVLAGSATGLDQVGSLAGVARDAAGRLYVVAMGAGSAPDAIQVYAAGAGGDQAPLRTISGPSTGLDYPDQVAVDAAGNLYSANYYAQTITVHAPDAWGDAAPVRTIGGPRTGLAGPTGLAVHPDGRLFVVDWDSSSVRVFAPGSSGDVAPERVIAGAATRLRGPESIALGADGTLYVANNGAEADDFAASSVLVFGPGASGDAAPVRRIAGAATGLYRPSGITVDAAGHLYVVNRYRELAVFGPGANGDVAPERTLSGPATGISMLWEVVLGADGGPTLPVNAEEPGEPLSVRTFSALVPGATPAFTLPTPAPSTPPPAASAPSKAEQPKSQQSKKPKKSKSTKKSKKSKRPSKVKRLRVKGGKAARVRTVRWAEPRRDGGRSITRYRVVVRKAGKKVVARTVRGTKHSVRFSRGVLRTGSHTVVVRARTRVGYGPKATTRFRVARR